MRSRLARWLPPLLLVLTFVVATVYLGWWQWDRSQSAGGTARNVAYAIQWPSFGAFAIFMLVRYVKLERRKTEPSAPDAPRDAPAEDRTEDRSSAEPTTERRRYRPPRWALAEAAAPDEELAAYNRYLADLADQHRRRPT